MKDLEILDLDENDETVDTSEEYSDSEATDYEEYDSAEDVPEDDSADSPDESEEKPKKKFRINSHIVLVAVILLVIAAVIYKLNNWGTYISQDEIFADGQGTYEDTLDLILPLVNADGDPIYPEKGKKLNILFFGNGPLSDERDSKTGVVNLIAKMTGANVYNCAISGSYMACENVSLTETATPMDAYTPYWLALLGTTGANEFYVAQAEASMGSNLPADAKEVRATLAKVDFNDIDVLCIMYDATDYLMGHAMYSDDNSTDITQFTGNLEATIEWIQSQYPNIRIIVMSPPYAFSDQLDENGEYISSDITRYGWDVLSTYVIKENDSCAVRRVTFVDNLYGTITEDEAKKYLSDNLHLNKAGRQKVAERFVYALNFYNEN